MNRSTPSTPAQRILGNIPEESHAATLVADLLEESDGIIQMQPEFVPRDFLLPGRPHKSVTLSQETFHSVFCVEGAGLCRRCQPQKPVSRSPAAMRQRRRFDNIR